MKKLIALLLSVILVFALIGCSSGKSSSQSYTPTTSSASTYETYTSTNEPYDFGTSSTGSTSQIATFSAPKIEPIELKPFEYEPPEYEMPEIKAEDFSYDYSSDAENDCDSDMVYISRTGSKYHNNPNCSNMNDPDYVTKTAAINMGREPCKNCY